MKTLFLCGAIFLSVNCFGQTKEKCCISEPLLVEAPLQTTDLPQIESFDGTFQIMVKQGDSFSFTDAFLARIQSERLVNEDVTLDLGNGRKLFILSQSNIQSTSFTPFTTPYQIY